MKVKCYAIYHNELEVFTEYANPAHRTFLTYELSTTLNRFKKSQKIEN